MIRHFRERLRTELETPVEHRRFGSGWISGVIALLGSLAALALVVCLLFPDWFTTPQLRAHYDGIPFRAVLHGLLIVSFLFALLNLALRQTKVLGFAAILLVLTATLTGQFSALRAEGAEDVFFGLDFFVLNVLFTGALFVPLERMFAQWPDQRLFRPEWREDLFYYFISSMMVQVLSFLTFWPALQIVGHTHWDAFKAMVGGQPLLLQFVEIMFLTDLVQYTVHRTFHRVPALWRFHAVHHSARSLDWLAGARMHFAEILVLRSLTVIPMMVLGFSEIAVQAYILAVYIHSTFVHANIRWVPRKLSHLIVTPRYHHWHHGIEKEAIDVNFAVHFPFIDRLFGTHYLPEGKWPQGYGIAGHPVPLGYLPQLAYPFRRTK